MMIAKQEAIFISPHSLACTGNGWYFLYMVTTAAPPMPKLCCMAILAPSTCLLSARPRSCFTSSAHWANPEKICFGFFFFTKSDRSGHAGMM